ncbi:UNVERIFIED_ORG: hypothetical protein GGE64_006258 [Rhizobium etli]|nr:hypothetical protein [Rhizobium leguminosarum]
MASDEPRPISTSPAALSPHRDDHALVKNLDPAAAFLRLVAADVEPDDLGTPQPAGKTDQQHRPVAQSPEGAAGQRLQHGDQVFGQRRFLLAGLRGVGVADRGEHSSDMAVLSVERCATPGIIPGQRRKSPLDRLTEFDLRPAIVARGGDPVTPGGTSGDVEADRLWVGRKHPTLAGGTTRNEMAADHCGAEMSPAAAVLRGGEEPAST